MKIFRGLAFGLFATWSAAVWAVPTVDGSLDVADYGAAVSVQTVQTQFGDNFNELNAAYATIDGGVLYLMFTGNLEDNFNKLMVFIDSKAGGQNSISGTNNPQNFDSRIGAGFVNGWDPYVNRGLPDSPAQAQAGSFTFDTGFEADYGMLFRNGAGVFDFDFAVMDQTAIPADELVDIFDGFLGGMSGDLSTATGNTSGTAYQVAFDNSNTGGVVGGTLAADPVAAAAATTGIEVAIPLSAIGSPVGDFKISAFINGSNHDFVSNQILGGLDAPQGFLGSDGQGNFLSADRLAGTDFDDDGTVDGGDFLLWQRGYLTGITEAEGDANRNGTVDGDDLALWESQFGGAPLPDGVFDDADSFDENAGPDPLGSGLIDLNDYTGDQFFTVTQPPVSVAGVPEPASLMLVLGAVSCGLLRRRSRC